MSEQDPFEALDQRTREVALAMDQLTAQMAQVQAQAEAIHQESEALRIAAAEAAEAARLERLRANYRTSGRIRFHIDTRKGFIIRAYVPLLSGTNKKLMYVGSLNRSWFKNENIWDVASEKINGFMEHIFQLGVDYQRDVIEPERDPGTGRGSPINTTMKVQSTSNDQPGAEVDEKPQRRLHRSTKNDAIGRLFDVLSLADQAEVTAFYMPSGVTAETLLAGLDGKSKGITTMAIRTRLRSYFRNNPDKEFTVEKAKDILQIHKQDDRRAAEVANGDD